MGFMLYVLLATFVFVAFLAGLTVRHKRALTPKEHLGVFIAAAVFPITLGALAAIFIGIIFSKIFQDINRF